MSHASGRPILFLPDRKARPDIPRGWTPVIADRVSYDANFVKVAVNVMRAGEDSQNQLPEILRRWFGRDAGLPGTNFHVAFELRSGIYHLFPLAREGNLEAR